MPQILNHDFPQALEKIVDSIIEANLPNLSTNSWAEKLEQNGLSVNQLAQQYVEALSNCKPRAKTQAIRELLQDLGVTKGPQVQTQQPTIVINSENVSLHQLILPERNR